VTHTIPASKLPLSHHCSDRGACGFVLVANSEVTPKASEPTGVEASPDSGKRLMSIAYPRYAAFKSRFFSSDSER
jgi:hypothetical protein